MLSLNALILVALHDEASNHCPKAIFSNINCQQQYQHVSTVQDTVVVYYPAYYVVYHLWLLFYISDTVSSTATKQLSTFFT